MALRPWQATIGIAFEGRETGDGRLMAGGSLQIAPLPLPLAYLRDGDQHVDLTEVAPQIGTIETAEMVDGALRATGFIDDETPDGAEALRRMENGSAPLGSSFPISIDGDDWALQMIVRDPDILDMLNSMDDEFAASHAAFSASGNSTVHLRAGASLFRQQMAEVLRARTAAAGDPDPGPDGGEDGEVLFEDQADFWLERFTQLRVRGATLCAVAAFSDARIDLVGQAATAAAGISSPAATALPADPYPPLPIPARPPAEWFAMPYPEPGDERLVLQDDGTYAVPLTILDNGQWFGNVAPAGRNHRGYSTAVVAPRSQNAYRDFHLGYLVCEDGTQVNVGPFCVGGDHAPLSMNTAEARDYYANSTTGWGDGVVVDGEFGPWACGALRPGLNEADLRVLRALTLSGDWRAESGRNLELICGLSVNAPGFPIQREAMAASALVASIGGCVGDACTIPQIHVRDGQVTALIAGGVARCAECQEHEQERTLTAAMLDDAKAFYAEARRHMRLMEARTRPFEAAAVEALAASIRPS